MTTAAPAWTRERLPAGVEVVEISRAACRTCGPTILGSDMLESWHRITRTVEPDGSGRYTIQPHQGWCPVWTGDLPDLPCPRCGAPVETIKHERGYSLAIPDARAPRGVGHLVGTADEVFGHPASVFTQPEPEPSLDQATVGPCGHTFQGAAAHHIIDLGDELRRAHLRDEADVILTGMARLLGAAERAGHGALVEAYRTAVRGRTRDVSGLLAALRILHPDAEGD